MYIPPINQLEDAQKIRTYIQQYPFANLITAQNNYPIATHLPFIIEQQDGKWFLLSHMAKANPQWQHLETSQPLIVFQEPHAYISPSYYDKEENVPTWNYVAVHVYGKATLLTGDDAAIEVLEKTIGFFEKDYIQQWQKLRTEYKNRLLKGMVAFKIEVTEWQGKEKLSQNKNSNEQNKITKGLLESDNNSARELGQIMQSKFKITKD